MYINTHGQRIAVRNLESNMDLFRTDNTEGYTKEQLAALNAEAAKRVPEIMASYGLDEDEARKAFADEVARR